MGKKFFWSVICLFAFLVLMVVAELSGSSFFPAEFFTLNGAAVVGVFLVFCVMFTFG